MKKFLQLLTPSIVTLFVCFNTVLAQPRAKIENARIAFISTRLNLDETAAQKFWPVFNRYTDELKAANQERKQANDALSNNTANDTELEKAINNYFNAQQKVLDINKRYKAEFLKILTVRQFAELLKVERDFKEQLIKRLGNEGGNSDGPRRWRRN
jgi:Spy/CpxP family protein refolding chaperone